MSATSPVPQPNPPRSRRRSWLLLSASVVAGLLITVGVFFAWLRSDSDLVGLRRELKAEHLPTTWGELDLHLSPPGALATWKRIGELSKQLKTFASAYPALTDTTAGLTPFSPVPDAARIHHATLDQDRLEGLRACIDALGDQRLELHTSSTYSTRMEEIGVGRNVVNLLREEVLLAAPAEAAQACRRLLRFIAIQPRGVIIAHLVRVSLTEIAFAAVASRLDVLKKSPQRVDDLVEALTAAEVGELPDMETREMLCAWTSFTTSPDRDNPFSVTDVRWLDPFLHPVVLRAGRAGYLRYEADLIHQYAQPLSADGPDALIVEFERRSSAKRFSATSFMVGMKDGTDAMILRMCHESRLHGLLLLAELRGTPWPRDPFDPTHPHLRALVRDGHTVGAYSVGRDGVDHFGKKPNRYYPLLERLDPLKPPPP